MLPLGRQIPHGLGSAEQRLPAGRRCRLSDRSTIVAKPANTTSTTPAYERLANANGEIRIVPTFIALVTREHEYGNTKPLAAAPGHVEEFARKDGGRRIVVRLFWGVTNIGKDSVAFFCMAKEAAERGSVFLYSGHSRVGLLDLAYMGDQIGAPISRMNHDQYQIYGFFGCSSYSYYNLSYFAAKASKADPEGTKNTDIITRHYGFLRVDDGFHRQDPDPHLQPVRARHQGDLAADHEFLLGEIPDRGQRRRVTGCTAPGDDSAHLKT